MKFTLNGAAKAAKVGKATIARAISSGRMSADKLDDGSYEIDGAELARAFPNVRFDETGETGRGTVSETAAEQPAGHPEHSQIMVLRAQLEAERELRRAAERQLEDTRQDRDRWAQQAERLALLPAPPTDPAPRRGFFGLFKRGTA